MSIEKLSPIKTLSPAKICADAILTGFAFAQIIFRSPEKSSVQLLVISIRSSCPSKYTSVICNSGRVTTPVHSLLSIGDFLETDTPVSISCPLCPLDTQVISSQLVIVFHDNTWLSRCISCHAEPVLSVYKL